MHSNIYYKSKATITLEKGCDIISIVFIHGNSLSLNSFVNQFNDPLLNKYNLYAVDLPGHGNSLTTTELGTTYSVNLLAESVAQFVNENIETPIILAGNSMGGNVAVEAAPKINNLKAMVLFGSSPVSSPEDIPAGFMQTEAIAYAFKNDISDDQLNDMCRANVGDNYEFDDLLKKDIRRTDKLFRESLGGSAAKGEIADEKRIVEELDVPLAIIHGENDNIANYEYIKKLKAPTLWRGEIQVIKNAPHLVHLTNPKEFNELLIHFLHDLNEY